MKAAAPAERDLAVHGDGGDHGDPGVPADQIGSH
jgi:hypothetical protein